MSFNFWSTSSLDQLNLNAFWVISKPLVATPPAWPLNAFEFENEIDIDRALKSKQRAETRINSKDEQIDLILA